jgi:hypothetical protein
MGIAVLPRFRSYAHINELTCHKIIEQSPLGQQTDGTSHRYGQCLQRKRYGSSSADEPKR